MSIWGAVGQERAHRTFNNESLNGWSCIVKCMKMCCVFVEAFVVLNPHRTHKRWDIKFSQSIKHKTCPLCWNINRASNLKATRRKSQKFPPAPFQSYPVVDKDLLLRARSVESKVFELYCARDLSAVLLFSNHLQMWLMIPHPQFDFSQFFPSRQRWINFFISHFLLLLGTESMNSWAGKYISLTQFTILILPAKHFPLTSSKQKSPLVKIRRSHKSKNLCLVE